MLTSVYWAPLGAVAVLALGVIAARTDASLAPGSLMLAALVASLGAAAGGLLAPRCARIRLILPAAIASAVVHFGWIQLLSTVDGGATRGHLVVPSTLAATRLALVVLVTAGLGAPATARAAIPIAALSPTALWVRDVGAELSCTLGVLAVALAMVAAGRRGLAWSIPLASLSGLVLAGGVVVDPSTLWWGIAVLGVYFLHRRAQLQLITGGVTVLAVAVLDPAGALNHVHTGTIPIPGTGVGAAVAVLAALVVALGPFAGPALRSALRSPLWPLSLAAGAVVCTSIVVGGIGVTSWLPALSVLSLPVAAELAGETGS